MRTKSLIYFIVCSNLTFTIIFRWLSIQSHKPSVGVHIFFNLNGHNIDSYASLFIAHAVVHNGRY